MIVDNTVKRPQ